MPLDSSFQLGPFTVDPQGRMEPSDTGRFPTFSLTWRGYSVHARLEAVDAADKSRACLLFTARVGRVPSTAGGDATENGAKRARIFGAVRSLEAVLPSSWRVSLLADHQVVIEARRPLALPASAVDLITQVTCFLLELAPYLDWLDETDSAGAEGTRNT